MGSPVFFFFQLKYNLPMKIITLKCYYSIHKFVQSSSHNSRKFSSLQKEALYPLSVSPIPIPPVFGMKINELTTLGAQRVWSLTTWDERVELQSYYAQRTEYIVTKIILRYWNLMEFAFVNFRLHLWLIFAFTFITFRMR